MSTALSPDTRIRSASERYVTTARYVLLIVLAGVFLIPIYVLLVTAFKDPTEVSPSQMWNLPDSLTLVATSLTPRPAGPAFRA